MKNRLLLTFPLICLISFAGSAFAETMVRYDYPEISMEAPASVKVTKNNYTDKFPGSKILSNNKELFVLFIPGQFPEPSSMEASVSQLSGFPIALWDLAYSSQNGAKGWKWRRDFQLLGAGADMYVMIGSGDKGSYILLMRVEKDEFTQNQRDYVDWIRSVKIAWDRETINQANLAASGLDGRLLNGCDVVRNVGPDFVCYTVSKNKDADMLMYIGGYPNLISPGLKGIIISKKGTVIGGEKGVWLAWQDKDKIYYREILLRNYPESPAKIHFIIKGKDLTQVDLLMKAAESLK